MTRWFSTAGIAALAVVGITSASAAGDFVFPAAWEGVWDFTDTERPCGEGGGTPEMSTEPLCEGDPILDGDEGDLECTGTVTDTEIHIVCTGEQPIEGLPGCTSVTTTFTLDAVRSGDSVNATSSFALEYNEGCTLPDTCIETVSTGTRTGADPECESPITPGSWAKIKSVYR